MSALEKPIKSDDRDPGLETPPNHLIERYGPHASRMTVLLTGIDGRSEDREEQILTRMDRVRETLGVATWKPDPGVDQEVIDYLEYARHDGLSNEEITSELEEYRAAVQRLEARISGFGGLS